MHALKFLLRIFCFVSNIKHIDIKKICQKHSIPHLLCKNLVITQDPIKNACNSKESGTQRSKGDVSGGVELYRVTCLLHFD